MKPNNPLPLVVEVEVVADEEAEGLVVGAALPFCCCLIGRCEEEADSRVVGVGVVSRFRGWGLEADVCSFLVGSAVRERERSGRTSSAGAVAAASCSLWARARSGRALLELCSVVSPFLVDPWPFSFFGVFGAPCVSVAFLVSAPREVSAMPILDCVAAGSD
jgi:hypothetical protein